jgi:hypothetical protein
MSAGDSARLSMIPDDPACGFDLEYRCRRVLVRSAAGGKLTLEAVLVLLDWKWLAAESFILNTRLERD